MNIEDIIEQLDLESEVDWDDFSFVEEINYHPPGE